MTTTRTVYLKGAARTAAQAKAKRLYDAGATIRAVAEQMGRSFGGTYALLVEAGTEFRATGGGKRKAGA